jgi:lipoprotein-anchoring transpeptidase ErfK/SrfK
MTSVSSAILLLALAFTCGTFVEPASAQLFKPRPMRKAKELIGRQERPKVFRDVEAELTPENARVFVNLSTQRALLMAGDRVFVDTPISSGKRAGMTPTGSFTISEKDPDHRSSIYGDFVDRSGRVVRSGISLKVDSAPSGTHYRGSPMRWFMRLTNSGVGMHTGILPGYPASHGCIRLPEEMARLIYSKVRIGTPVAIVP